MSNQQPAAPHSTGAHLRAAGALLIGFFLVCAGTPGARSVGTKPIAPDALATLKRKTGPLAPALIALHQANRKVRVPIAKSLIPIQSFFRISQSWGLYGAGPSWVRQIQIEVDGQPVYLTNSSELTWRAAQLSHRKIRPMPETMSIKAEAFNWTGFSRWILKETREDFPEATDIRILAIWTSRALDAEPYIHHGRQASAPDWVWQQLGKDGAHRGVAKESAEDLDEETDVR